MERSLTLSASAHSNREVPTPATRQARDRFLSAAASRRTLRRPSSASVSAQLQAARAFGCAVVSSGGQAGSRRLGSSSVVSVGFRRGEKVDARRLQTDATDGQHDDAGERPPVVTGTGRRMRRRRIPTRARRRPS
jgi:hypothetical protein